MLCYDVCVPMCVCVGKFTFYATSLVLLNHWLWPFIRPFSLGFSLSLFLSLAHSFQYNSVVGCNKQNGTTIANPILLVVNLCAREKVWADRHKYTHSSDVQ